MVTRKTPMLTRSPKMTREEAYERRIETAEKLEREGTATGINGFWLTVFMLGLAITSAGTDRPGLALLSGAVLDATGFLNARHVRAVLGLLEAIAFARGPLER